MTLISNILRSVASKESLGEKYPSPPPEPDMSVVFKTKKRRVYKYAHIPAVVDTSPPCLLFNKTKKLSEWTRDACCLRCENINLLFKIKRQYDRNGKVDSRWSRPLPRCTEYFERRQKFLETAHKENLFLHKRLVSASPRVQTADSLREDWERNRRDIIQKAEEKFVLFPPCLEECLEDPAFLAPIGFKRPRAYISLRLRKGAMIGVLQVELFTDCCPLSCRLFTELLDGDGLGNGYVGTCFYTKVPGLYWSGGDVIHDNGFGCYAQRGRRQPIPAENFHYSHSMPGLLSMRVSDTGEMCGSFNITFKPLRQFDLRNVVFGRIIRPSKTYESIRELGSALNTQPVVEIAATRRYVEKRLVCGKPNMRIPVWNIVNRVF